MFEKIFGKKEEMFDMTVYWKKDVNTNDLVSDLNALGSVITRSTAFKAGSRIVTVGETFINEIDYIAADLYVDKMSMKQIETMSQKKMFKAVSFVKTIVG